MWWLVLGIILCFGAGALFGAPYLPARRVDIEAALDLAELKKGETLIDLGSGDGVVLLAAAKRGAYAIGYEVNPLLYLWSLARTRTYRSHITIHLKNYWRVKLPVADVIYAFLITRRMRQLDTKLRAELQQPTRVVSYVFELPLKPAKQTSNTYLYLYRERV